MHASISARAGLPASSLSSAIRYVSTADSSPRRKLFSCSTEDFLAMTLSFVSRREMAAGSTPVGAELGVHDVARERHALVAQRGAVTTEQLLHLVLWLTAPRAGVVGLGALTGLCLCRS